MVDVLVAWMALKALPRSGWIRAGIPEPESVAAHTWGVAILTLALLPDDLDRGRALAYALLHDLPEIHVGDLTPHDGVPPDEKRRRERRALAALTDRLPRGATLRALWEAYEAQADPEARFVKQIDRLDMALQAIAYRRAHGLPLDEFLASATAGIDDPRLLALLRDLA